MENFPALDPDTLLPLLLALLPIIFVIVLVPAILFCIIVHRALAHCSPASRTMAPWLAWLELIPIFGLVWTFRVVGAVASSLHNEFVRRGMPTDSAPGKGLGTAYATLALLSAVPLVNFVTTLPAAVCWALYCIRIATLTSRLAGPAGAITRPGS
jgi:hypothetical protein